MLDDRLRRAFADGAGGLATVEAAELRRAPAENSRWLLEADSKKYTLHFAGWHADGTPFLFVSAVFSGDPYARARKISEDLVAAHIGTRRPTMSRKVSGLARLMGLLDGVDSDADALADRLEKGVKRVQSEMSTTRAIVTTVETAAAELQAVNRKYSNGDPTEGSA